MRPTTGRSLSLLAVAAALLGAGWAAPAAAQDCCDDWNQPYICHLEVTRSDAAPATRRGDTDVVRLRTGERVDLAVRAYDQHGRGYPADEIRYNVEGGDCDGVASWEAVSSDVLRVQARSRSGACQLTLRVPGNRNLDQRVRLEIGQQQTQQPVDARSEAVEIAERLYLGVLGREPDDRGLQDAVLAIRSNRTEQFVRDMFDSQEYREKRSGLTAQELLDSLYRGMLGRPADETARQSHMPRMVRGRAVDVVLYILQSDEFRSQVAYAGR